MPLPPIPKLINASTRRQDFAYQQKQSGNLLAVAAQLLRGMERMSLLLRGTQAHLIAKQSMLLEKLLTPTVSTTCWAMFGSGAKIGEHLILLYP